MSKVAILVDSIACLPHDTVMRYGVRILPINIVYKGQKYRDGIDLTVRQAYQMLEDSPENFFSSPSSIGEYLAVFQEAARETDQVLCITLSKKLSTMYNIATLAVNQAKEEFPGVTFQVMDSRNAAISEGLIVSAAARAAAEGKNLEEVVRVAERVAARVDLIGVLETIRYVYRTGRVPKLASSFGSMLKIKPLITISEGLVKPFGVTKNQESGISRILKRMNKNTGTQPVHVAIAHAEAMEAGERLQEKIQSSFNCVELWLTDFSPVMAYATGKGVLVVAYYSEN